MTLDDLLAKWLDREGGAERANYQMFLSEFASALGLPTPDPKGTGLGDYEFEAPVKSEAALGRKGTGRIDLYKRGCFILEAKQSQLKPGEQPDPEPLESPPATVYDLFGHAIGVESATRRPRPRYDRLMADARLQAERYALALPDTHPSPPFLVVADIGRAFEVYFDWAGNGRGYAPFPDERHYRVGLAELRDPEIADRFVAIWTDPARIDPRLKAAAVTRDIAERLSRVAAALEADQLKLRGGDPEIALGIEATSLFLMRTLFCMFAEDVGRDSPPELQLLPADSFKRFLADAVERSDRFWRSGLSELWSRMNDPVQENRFWSHGDAIVRYFNGNLFSATRIFDLSAEHKRELLVAAGKDWRAVEPAIFGTLLEQVLTAKDRAKLGAHYTPRAYVERLVEATMMEVLRPEWEQTLAAARAKADAGDAAGAVADAAAFHARLVALRVLDPACGTGNFLYVAMEQLLRLEGEVRTFAAGLGGAIDPAVHPNQFLGLELNPRAAVIAELVLWIGWLRYRLANTPEAIGTPVLPPLSNINGGTHGGFDAVLVRTATGEPDVANPRRPEWPEADFIVGNPPFIGAKFLRERLGGAYAEALWAANPRVPKSANFVMHWWDRAADILTRPGARLRRFGFVTTNSITQVFSRRVIERWLASYSSPLRGEGSSASPSDAGYEGKTSLPAGGERESKLHLTLAIADHPWTRVGKDAAAVRIAMTVAERDDAAEPAHGEGRLVTIVGERALDTDAPELDEREAKGRINADLTLGTDVTRAVQLRANEGICSPGVKLHGAGFIVSPAEAKALGLGTRPGLEAHIRDYRNGRDLLQRPRGAMVIDLFGLNEEEVMDRFPEVYQHLLTMVRDTLDEEGKPNGRAVNARESYRKMWWVFGEPRRDLRPALQGLSRYCVTPITAKQRIFSYVDGAIIPDDALIVFATDELWIFGVLNSAIHLQWTYAKCSLIGVASLEQGHRYNNSQIFDTFSFPDATPNQRAAIAALAERLDQTRRTALAENPSLTMTGLYNLVAEARADAKPPAAREAEIVRARARIVAKLHDDLDAAVAAAYGWAEDWKQGPLPPAEIVARLVALNAERAAEEAQGQVRWLRPDYQVPRFATSPDTPAAPAASGLPPP